MISLKNESQFAAMREAGRITGEALLKGAEAVKPGVTTKHIDSVIHDYIVKCGARPSFLGYGGFPASACVSLNSEVIHGIPSQNRVIEEGDIVKLDAGAEIHGFNGDSARTVACGKISEQAQTLIDVTRESFWQAVGVIKAAYEKGEDARLGDIGHAVEEYVKKFGFSVVRKYVGHGIGHNMHESPDVPNYGVPGRGQRVVRGMAIAIEPMVNIGGYAVRETDDNWTVLTADGSLSSHYEHTVALTENGVEIMTLVE